MDCVFLRFSRLLMLALSVCGPRVAVADEPSTSTATSPGEVALSQMPGHWTRIPGRARDIGVDARGVPWIVSLDEKAAGGFAILRRTGSAWSEVDGGAVKIAVAPNGDVWIVDDAGQIRSRKAQDNRWTNVPGRAREISISPDGGVWKVGTDKQGDDYWIYKYDGADWRKMEGSAVHLSAGSNGNIWIVNSAGKIYWRGKNDWTHADTWQLQEGAQGMRPGCRSKRVGLVPNLHPRTRRGRCHLPG